MENVVITGAARTAIGSFGGSLKDVPPIALATQVTRKAMERAKVSPDKVDNAVFGNVIHTEPRDMYLARAATIEADIPQTAPALTLNRLCGSGLQAIATAAQSIRVGDSEVAVAGGAENMSRAPFATQAARFGQKMGDVTHTDMMLGALTDPFGHGHMGVTAENVAEAYQIGRAAQDAFAAESHRRAFAAIKEGRFDEQIVPVEIRRGREQVMFTTDEHVREGVSEESLGGMRPVFSKNGSVTAGNASGLNDGAGAIVLMSERQAEADDVEPLARFIDATVVGVDPAQMGVGPIPAVTKLLERTGVKLDDVDVIESNEAFAAQACAVSQTLGLNPERVNPNGGAIALGHPIGATGAILTVKLVYELQRTNGRYGVVTMCIGGGQGIAALFERV